MTAGLFGLAGVLVGGLITAGIEWWREQRRRRGEVRVAARLVSDELVRADALIGMVEADPHDEQIPHVRDRLLGFPSWTAYQAVLARETSEEAWAMLVSAYVSVEVGVAGRIGDEAQWRDLRATALREATTALRRLEK